MDDKAKIMTFTEAVIEQTLIDYWIELEAHSLRPELRRKVAGYFGYDKFWKPILKRFRKSQEGQAIATLLTLILEPTDDPNHQIKLDYAQKRCDDLGIRGIPERTQLAAVLVGTKLEIQRLKERGL